MQQVRCGLCGRDFIGDLAANPTCPSCGYAGAIAVAETSMPSAAAVPADVSIVRHFDPATMGQQVPVPSEPAPMRAEPPASAAPRADESPTLPSQPYPAYQAPPPPSFSAQPDPAMTQAETPPPAPVAPPTQPTPAPPPYTPVPEVPLSPVGYAPYQAPATQPPYPYAPAQAPGAPYGYPQQPPAGYSPQGMQGMQAPPTMPPTQSGMPTYGSPYGAPGGFQPPYPGMMAPPPPEKRRNNTLIAVIAGIVLLAIVLGVIGVLALKGRPHANATPTPTATAQPTATATTSTVPTGFTAYTDANKLYSIGYPSDWSKTETSASGVSEALFANSDHSDIFEVAETSAAGYSTSDLSSVLGGFFTGFAGSLPGGKGHVANQTSPQDVSIAGQTWTQEAADVNYTDSSGASATAHAEVAAVVQNNYIFIIAGVTQDATVFDTENSLYFTPMTDTFTFLG